MKKGRPAHTVSALADPALAGRSPATLLCAETGSLGVRGRTHRALAAGPRATASSTSTAEPVRVKVGAGRVKVEHDDAAAAARRARPAAARGVGPRRGRRAREPRRRDRVRRRRRRRRAQRADGGRPPGDDGAPGARAGAGADASAAAPAPSPSAPRRPSTTSARRPIPFGAFSPPSRPSTSSATGSRWCHPPVAAGPPVRRRQRRRAPRGRSPTTAAGFGLDGTRYRQLVEPFLGPVAGPGRRHPRTAGAGARRTRSSWPGSACTGPRSAAALVRRFRSRRRAGLFAGLSAHSYLPLDRPFTGGIGLSLGLAAHAVGWPVAARRIAGDQRRPRRRDPLARRRDRHGATRCTRLTSCRRRRPPSSTSAPASSSPSPATGSARWRGRGSSSGGGTDRARARPTTSCPDPCRGPTTGAGGPGRCTSAGASRTSPPPSAPPPAGRWPSGPSPSWCSRRSPILHGRRTASTSCGPTATCPTATAAIAAPQLEGQLDRFAPGWRDLVRRAPGRGRPLDFAGGQPQRRRRRHRRRLARREPAGRCGPWAPLHPYRTPVKGVWLCSASTPPGAGAHGMCGWHAAGDVLDTAG